MRVNNFTSKPVDHGHAITGVVHEQFVAARMILAHCHRQLASPASSALANQKAELPKLEESVEQAKTAGLERRKAAAQSSSRFQPSNSLELAQAKVVACKREIEAGKQIVTDLERELVEAESLLDFAQGNLHQAINQVIHHDHVGELLQRFKANLQRTLADANELSYPERQRIIAQAEHLDVCVYLTDTLGSSLSRLIREALPNKIKWLRQLEVDAYAEIEWTGCSV